MKKKKVIGICLIVGMVVSVVVVLNRPYYDNSRSDLSVHDINWDDVDGMNEKIVAIYFSDPPFFKDERVDASGYLVELLQFFGGNQDLLRDSNRHNDMEILFEFENVIGNEDFLNEADPSGTFILHFYFDRALESEFFELINVARRARRISLNPSLVREEISLADVNWLDLMSDYGTQIYGVMLVRRQRVRQHPDLQYGFDIADFDVGRDDLAVILEFLAENQDLFSDIETEEYPYMGSIRLKEVNENGQRVSIRFFMNEELTRILSDEIIGEELWNLRQRGGGN